MKRQSVKHSTGEFVRGDVHANTAEGFKSLLKHGIVGTFQHVGKGLLGKYVSEFEFRYNARKLADKDRKRALSWSEVETRQDAWWKVESPSIG